METILEENFGFLNDRCIHELVAIAWEGIHSIKIGKNGMVVMKIDLANSYDKVNRL